MQSITGITITMRTIRTKVYKFNELNDDAKQKAIEHFKCYPEESWYESVYDDAAQVGIKIKAFNLDRGNYIKIEMNYAFDVAEKITLNHGEGSETYKTAKQYLIDRKELVDESPVDEDDCYVGEYEFDRKIDELDKEFKHDIGQDYLTMLKKEYEYLTSEESIIEMIDANEYEFYVDGRLV